VVLRTVAAMSLLGLTACDPYVVDLSCRDNGDCLDSEICHPYDQVCVQLCNTNSNCREWAPTCEAVGSADPTRVCKCKGGDCVGKHP
jgi:hypothetical protein